MARKKQLLQNATIFTEPPTLTKYSHNAHKENMKPGRKIVTRRGLHLAQPSATKLKERGQIHRSADCKRCRRAEETKKHWLFYYPSSQNLFIYLLNLLEDIDITQVIDNTIQDCLLTLLLEYRYKVPASMELFEI